MAKSVEECNREIRYWTDKLSEATKELKWWNDELREAIREQQDHKRAA